MPNTGVRGKVVDEFGAGISGLEVVAYDLDPLYWEDRLNAATTSASGDFSIVYPAQAYGPFETEPDIVVRIFDPVGRILFESTRIEQVTDPILDIGGVTVPTDVLRGFRVTLRQGYPTASPPPAPVDPYPLLSQNNLVRSFVDNEAAWGDLTQAVQQATQFVHIIQLWFNVGRFFSVFNPPTPPIGSPTAGIRLEELLLQRSRAQGLPVRLLLNDVEFDPGLLDSVVAVTNYYDQARQVAPHTVQALGFRRPYNTPLHAKVAIVDGRTAYVLGSPFIQGYFDGPTHRIDDPRRGIASFFEHTDNSPLHDVSASIQGPAVGALNDSFRLLWNHRTVPIPAAAAQPPASSNATVQVVRTLPGNLFATVPRGETGILEAYLKAIREAQDFIYLDNQYVTEPMIGNALIKALQASSTLQVIMVANGRVDIPFYNRLQPDLINRILNSLTPSQRARIGVFTLWSHETTPAPQRIIRIYTHAKVGLVDEAWATVGSANLDGVSLRLSHHVIPPITDRDRLEERGIEVNALFFNGVDGLPASPVPAELRRALWAEHLGYGTPNHPDLQTRPAVGWLDLWRTHAAAKLTGLGATPPTGHPARILEWRPEADPVRHLLALGLTKSNLKNLVVETSGRSFNPQTGQWE